MSFSELSFRLRRRTLIATASTAALAGLVGPARAAPKAPWLGVALEPAPAGGILVDFVFRKSPAEAAGLASDDMILRADGIDLERPADLVERVRSHAPGDTLTLVVRRGGRERTMKVVLVAHPGEEEIVRRMHVGTQAADLPGLASVQGDVFTAMKDVRGEVVLVEFFASWCVGCKAQAPMLSAWHEKLAARGLRSMGVTAEDRDEARRVASAWKLSYAVACDVERKGHRAYHVSGIPALFLIDRRGTVREAVVGYRPAQREPLEKLIETLLAEKK